MHNTFNKQSMYTDECLTVSLICDDSMCASPTAKKIINNNNNDNSKNKINRWIKFKKSK